MRIFIMAQGAGTRWNGKTPKHLCKIGGETLVGRIIRQCHQHGRRSIILVGRFEQFRHLDSRVGLYQIARPSPEVCHGIQHIIPLWKGADRIVILMGDTVYSDELMGRILGNQEPVKMWGRLQPHPLTGKPHTERFALSFELRYAATIIEGLDKALAQEVYPPTLKALYCAMIEAPFIEGDSQIYFEDVILEEVSDWTDDIDSLEEYDVVKEVLEPLVMQERRAVEP